MKESQVRVEQGLLVRFAGTHGEHLVPRQLGDTSEFDAHPWAITVAIICAASPGALVNTAYYGASSLIEEFMTAATDLFSEKCLLQFEDHEKSLLCGKDFVEQQGCLFAASILTASRTSTPTMPSLYWRLGDSWRLARTWLGLSC